MARIEEQIRMIHDLSLWQRWKQYMIRIMTSRIMIHSFIGFLLGRAVILDMISPFALAYIAALVIVYQKQYLLVYLSIIAGSLTYSIEQSSYLLIALLVFSGLYFIGGSGLKHRGLAYVFLFFSIAMSRVLFNSIISPLTTYDALQIILECSMAMILLFIFIQALPLLFHQATIHPLLKTDEIICLVILMASIITGLIHIEIYHIALEHTLARFIVLVFAFIGGAAIGSAVGVVVGIILALAQIVNVFQMSLLAFSGLLGGIFKEWGKPGVSLGLLVGTILLGTYAGMETLLPTLLISLVAILMFALFPQSSMEQMAKHIPGSSLYRVEETQYMKKIRDITAERVERFSGVFSALATSFLSSTPKDWAEESKKETDYFLSSMAKKTCNHCFMKKHCWQKNFQATYQLLEDMKEQLVESNTLDKSLHHRFKNHCVKSHQVMDILQSEAETTKLNRQLKRQVVESKKIVADQLQGVSDVMDQFAKEMVKERMVHEQQEEEIIAALQRFHLPIEAIDAFSLEQGNVDIDIQCAFSQYHGEAEKLVAPILTNVLGEEIVLDKEEISLVPHTVSRFTFRSAQRYEMETGVAIAAKDGGLVSGDSYSLLELSKGKFTMAISDGMGNGKRANEESSETIHLLQKMLETGISEKVAIQSINSILTLRTTDEVFSTLDLAIFNLYHAYVRFVKVSAMPSFIKRGNDVWQISANNLPIGMIEHVELDTVTESLKPGDLIIMVSDGVFNRTSTHIEQEETLQKKIQAMKTTNPQEMADILLEEVVRTENGYIHDDITVVVAKMKRHIPKWSAIEVEHPIAR